MADGTCSLFIHRKLWMNDTVVWVERFSNCDCRCRERIPHLLSQGWDGRVCMLNLLHSIYGCNRLRKRILPLSWTPAIPSVLHSPPGSSPVLKPFTLISLHTVTFLECALEVTGSQRAPHFLAGGCPASSKMLSSSFFLSLAVITESEMWHIIKNGKVSIKKKKQV